MPSAHSRRTRLSYSTELEKAKQQAALVQTPIERVQETLISSSQSSVSRYWTSSNTLDNIRMTSFGFERTDYTYGDSGSYKSDRIKNSWKSPNMSRLPLRHQFADRGVVTLSSRELEQSSRTMNSKEVEKRLNVIATKVPDVSTDDNDEEDDISSRSSIASTRSSNRVVRSRCKKIPGDWCTHYECVTFGSTRRLTTTTASSLQRNTNNTTDSIYSLNVTEPEVSSVGRQRRSRRTPRGNVNLTQTVDHSIVNHPVEVTDRSDRVASTSSTYVYTYVPAGETVGGADVIVAEPKPSLENGDGPELNEGFWQRRFAHRSSDKDTQVLNNQFNRTATNQSSNNTTSRGWLTRHIFGLEQTDSAESPSSQFISSDAEDADTMISSRSHSRRNVGSTVGHSATIRTSVARKSQGLFSRIFDYGVRVLRRLLSIILTILLSILYAGYALLSGAVYVTTSAVRTVSSKLFTSGSSRSSGKLALHPRLTRFDHPTTSSSLVDEEPDFLTRSMHSTAFGLSKLGSCCCRLCGILCFLVPLFLLLAFLFAPVSIDDGDDETPPMLLPHLTDANCQQVLPHHPMPENSSSWSLAIWRFRCLYWLYFLDSPPTNESMKSISSEPAIDTAATWSKWLFGWFAKPTSVDTVSQPVPIGQSADTTRLLEQLAAFSQAVNKRLDSLSMSIRVTETRVADVENQSNDRVKNLSAQLSDLQAQFHTHTASIHEWRLQMLSLANQSGPDMSTLTGEYDRLFHAVTEAVNHTVMFYLEQLRTDVNDSVNSQLGRHDATMVNLSLLLAQLRHHLTRRLRYAENKLSQLNFQLRTELSKQSRNQTTLATEINELRGLIDNMSERLVLLQRGNTETNALITDLQEASRRCTEQQSQQLSSCKQVASDYAEAAIGRLTTLLTTQIADLVKENFLQQLQPSDSVVHTKLSAMIEQTTRETVAVALRDHIQTQFTDTTGKPIIHPDYFNVQRQIDASLERFAADRTGLPDFALESAGGTVIATRCTRTYTGGAALFSLFGIPLVRLSNSPRTILHPSNNAGDCWPFHGSSGQVVIRLSDPIVINAVSLEHLPRVLARTGRSDSAPKDFLIKGLASEVDEEGVVLGNFTYNIDGPSIQTYIIKDQSKTWQFVELAILSNHGHPLYTCVYRLRVHGKLASS